MEKADTNASSPTPYQWVRASKRKYQSNILILMMADLKYVVLAFSPVRVFSHIFTVRRSKYSVVRHNFHFSFAAKRSPPRKTMKWIIHFINGSDALSCFWPNHYYFIRAYIHVPTTLYTTMPCSHSQRSTAVCMNRTWKCELGFCFVMITHFFAFLSPYFSFVVRIRSAFFFIRVIWYHFDHKFDEAINIECLKAIINTRISYGHGQNVCTFIRLVKVFVQF